METTFTLTRYLYPKHNVEQSLIYAILEQNKNEACFWAYELYYSGFRKEFFDLIISVYFMFYDSPENSHIHKTLYSLIDEWYKRENEFETTKKRNLYHDNVVYHCIELLESTQHSLLTLMRHRSGVTHDKSMIENDEYNIIRKNIHTKTKLLDVTKYKTCEVFSWKVFPQLVQYPIRNVQYYLCNDMTYSSQDQTLNYVLYKLSEYHQIPPNIRDNWLYYCSKSPLWKKRIIKYDGIINDETETVVIPDYFHDDFYDSYNYELDEQSSTVFRCLYSCCDDMCAESWDDFYQKYGKFIIHSERKVSSQPVRIKPLFPLSHHPHQTQGSIGKYLERIGDYGK